MSVQCSLIVARIAVAEVIDDQIADELREGFLTLYEKSGATHAIVDLQEVTYLCSVGIGPFLALSHKVREREGRFILCSMSPFVESVMHATKLIGAAHGSPATFEHQADVPAAVQSLYRSE